MIAPPGFYPDSIFLVIRFRTFIIFTGIFNTEREGYFVSLSYSIFEECRLTCGLLCMAYMMYMVGMMRGAPMVKRLTSNWLGMWVRGISSHRVRLSIDNVVFGTA